jgi:hypothetical protein
MKYLILMISVCGTLLMMESCASVKPYQKSKLNDAEMILSSRPIEKYQNNFLIYREGASGGNGGKTGGGCGCN